MQNQPVQREVRVDSLDDGAEFEVTDFVPKHFGFTSAGALIYRKWLKDGVDHHYATKQQLVAAIEALARPSRQSFGGIFAHAAQQAGVDIHWLEQYLTDMGGTLQTLNLETPEMIVEKIHVRNPNSTISVEQIEDFTLQELMEQILLSNIMTQSCGQTANLIHEFLAPSTTGVAPVEMDLSAVISAIRSANDKSASELKHQNVKIEGGGHAFVVEVFNDRGKIFQSFFGRYSFAKDLERNKSYPLGQFVQKLENALATTPVSATAPAKVDAARIELFNSGAVHPDGKFRINIFASESNVEQRIANKFAAQSNVWNPRLGDAAKDHLHNGEPEDAMDGPPVTILDYEFKVIGMTLDFGDINEDVIKNGGLDIGATAMLDAYRFVLKSKTATNYRFEYDPA